MNNVTSDNDAINDSQNFSSSLLLFSVKRQFLNVHIYTRNEKWKNVREKVIMYIHVCSCMFKLDVSWV